MTETGMALIQTVNSRLHHGEGLLVCVGYSITESTGGVTVVGNENDF